MTEITILDLGCGTRRISGAIKVDNNKDVMPDVIHDLNNFPYPFEDSSVDLIILNNTLEHLDNTVKVLEEVYRILKVNGKCKIFVPYFRSKYAFCDPTHKNFYTLESFRYFDPEDEIFKRYKYSKATFKIEKIIINPNQKNNFFLKLLIKFATKHKYFYESFLSNIFPFNEIYFELKKIYYEENIKNLSKNLNSDIYPLW